MNVSTKYGMIMPGEKVIRPPPKTHELAEERLSSGDAE